MLKLFSSRRVWSDGSPTTFTNFNVGEPNGKRHERTDGAYMYATPNDWVAAGSWDDEDTLSRKPFVCERPRNQAAQCPSAALDVKLSWLVLGLVFAAGGAVALASRALVRCALTAASRTSAFPCRSSLSALKHTKHGLKRPKPF